MEKVIENNVEDQLIFYKKATEVFHVELTVTELYKHQIRGLTRNFLFS